MILFYNIVTQTASTIPRRYEVAYVGMSVCLFFSFYLNSPLISLCSASKHSYSEEQLGLYTCW